MPFSRAPTARIHSGCCKQLFECIFPYNTIALGYCVLGAVEILAFSAFGSVMFDSSVGRALTHFRSRRWKARRSNRMNNSVCIASDSLLMRRNDYPPNGAIHVNTAVRTRCAAAVVPPACGVTSLVFFFVLFLDTECTKQVAKPQLRLWMDELIMLAA